MKAHNPTIFIGDCLRYMNYIKDKSIDLIVCDLPYGVTLNPKDKRINLKKLWIHYERIIKYKGVIVLTSQFPFTLDLINSNKKWFRYDLIWDKQLTSGFLNANRMPLRSHEHILVFYKKLGTYNPQFTEGQPLHSKGSKYLTKLMKNQNYGKFKPTTDKRKNSTSKYPKSIISIQKPHPSKAKHRTEKPVELAEYLILTYSNENDYVLDNCCGCGWTAVASAKHNRNFVGIDLEPTNYQIIFERLNGKVNK